MYALTGRGEPMHVQILRRAMQRLKLLHPQIETLDQKAAGALKKHADAQAGDLASLRRILAQAAHAAARKKGCHFQNVFRRLLPKLGYDGALWAIANAAVPTCLENSARRS